jgi:hypothetical protein
LNPKFHKRVKRGARKKNEEMLFGYSRDKHHAEPYAGYDHSSSEVRLQSDKSKENGSVYARYNYVPYARYFDMPARKIFGEDKNKKKLG